MISRLKNLTIDQAALGLIILLIIAIAMVLLIGNQAGILIDVDLNPEGQGPFEAITLSFSAPVDRSQVEALFELDPKADGQFKWKDSQTLRFIPGGLEPDTRYRLTLRSGMIDEDNEISINEKIWSFKTRSPLITYIKTIDGNKELWAVEKDGSGANRLLDSEKSIFSYDVSPDGEFLILALLNDQGRVDLWRFDRETQYLALLLDCEGGICSSPNISPDGNHVAYTREAPGITPDSPLSAPRAHLIDLISYEDRPLFSDPQIIGYGATWSPDGNWIASYDGIQDLIQVVSIQSGEITSLRSSSGSTLTWSPDSTRLAYATVEDGEAGLVTVVMIADLRSGEISYLIGKQSVQDYHYSALAWSPTDEESLLLGLRTNPDNPATGIWLIRPTLLEGRMIAEEENHSYSNPKWDPWGNAVIFHQIELKTANKPEIAVWDPSMSDPLMLDEGFSAHWMP